MSFRNRSALPCLGLAASIGMASAVGEKSRRMIRFADQTMAPHEPLGPLSRALPHWSRTSYRGKNRSQRQRLARGFISM